MNQLVVLASRSPRRIDLLQQLGVNARVMPADIDEIPLPKEQPMMYVERLAREKAATVSALVEADAIVIGADTTIDIDGIILGQPEDALDARRMLKLLSARSHRVHTGVAVHHQGQVRSCVVSTIVTCEPITDALVDWYLETGEWRGKAGSYAIQGLGGTLVQGIRGSLSNVVGLPLTETAHLLRKVGLFIEPIPSEM